MALSIADIIESELRSRTLEIRDGRLAAVNASHMGAQVTVHARKEKQSLYVNCVINCTGPNMNYRQVSSTLLQNLFERGVVTEGPLGTGFHCSDEGAVIDAKGQVSEIIFNVGPGRLGDLFESIAVLEIRQQAVDLALVLIERLNQASALTEEGPLRAEAEVLCKENREYD